MTLPGRRAGTDGPLPDAALDLDRPFGRLVPPAETVRRVRPWMSELGITRLARLTHLDAIGIPVWSAVRPNARTVSVSQGKGEDDDHARASALMEAVELAVAERPDRPVRRAASRALAAERLRFDTLADLVAAGQGEPAVDTPIDWTPAIDLFGGAPVWVPAEAVVIDDVEAAPGEERRYWQATDGLASGNGLEEAVTHGLLERIERDACALWQFRRPEDAAARCFDPADLADPRLDRLTARIAAAGLRVRLFEITTNVGVPVVLALLGPEGRTRGAPLTFDLASGSGCHPSLARAAMRAVTEAAQSRLTVIAATRDDFSPALYARPLEAGLADDLRVDPPPRASRQPPPAAGSLRGLVAALARAGIRSVMAVPLSPPDRPFAVAKVLVPDLEHPPGARRRRAGARAIAEMMRMR